MKSKVLNRRLYTSISDPIDSKIDLSGKTIQQELADLKRATSTFIQNSKSLNTRMAYQSDWNQYKAWCEEHLLPYLPASEETISLYITHLATTEHKTSTIQRQLSSISQAHISKGHETPTKGHLVQTTWSGIRKTVGSKIDRKLPITTEHIRKMIDQLPDSAIGSRDRAILLVGFSGAFRRSELVNIRHEDIEFQDQGMIITIQKSKTDQNKEGQKIAIAYGKYPHTCPVRSLQEWLETAVISAGPIFRSVNRFGDISDDGLSDKSVARIVKKYITAIGLDPTNYAGHSLRSGLVTASANAGVEEYIIMDQTRHKSVAVLRRYIREASMFKNNASGRIGL